LGYLANSLSLVIFYYVKFIRVIFQIHEADFGFADLLVFALNTIVVKSYGKGHLFVFPA
jgi:hypothetical protein